MEYENALLNLVAVWGLAFLSLTYFAMIIIERVLYIYMRPGQYDDNNAFGSFTTNIFANATQLILSAFIPLLTYVLVFANFRFFDPGLALWTWFAAFFIHETAYFFGHWIGHRVSFFWAWHRPHHSSERLTLTTAARGFTFGDPLANFFGLTGALLGIDPVVYLAVVTLKNFWGMFNHTGLVGRMGVLDRFMATPSNHGVHHGRNPQYIDKNYGQVLVIWDKIFGTYEPEVEPPDYGLVVPMDSNNPLRIWADGWMWLAARMRSAPDRRTAFKYLYKPPEWTHEQDATAAETLP